MDVNHHFPFFQTTGLYGRGTADNVVQRWGQISEASHTVQELQDSPLLV